MDNRKHQFTLNRKFTRLPSDFNAPFALFNRENENLPIFDEANSKNALIQHGFVAFPGVILYDPAYFVPLPPPKKKVKKILNKQQPFMLFIRI